MAQPTDTLLDELRDAVYHRYKVDQSQRLPPAEGAELRGARFSAWLAESQGADLDAELVRHWAVVDIMAHQEASFPPADEPSQRRVLEVMQGNARRQPGYALTMKTLMPDLSLGDTANTSSPDRPGTGSQPPAATPHERAAALAIEQTNAALLAVPADTLRQDEARDKVRADVAALQSVHNQAERHFAAISMGASAQRHRTYRAELEAQAPQVAREVEAALQEDARRTAAKEERKRAESDFLLVEIERRPGPVGTAETPAVVETARSDAEAVRRISTIDERTLALMVMGWRAYEHDGYREALRSVAPDIASVAVALQARLEDDAYKLPRDPADDAMLDAAVRGLHPEVAPSSRVAPEHAASDRDEMATGSNESAAALGAKAPQPRKEKIMAGGGGGEAGAASGAAAGAASAALGASSAQGSSLGQFGQDNKPAAPNMNLKAEVLKRRMFGLYVAPNMTDSYTVFNLSTLKQQNFTDAKEAGAAFFKEEGESFVVQHGGDRTVRWSRVIADTDVTGTGANKKYIKVLASNAELAPFRAGYEAVDKDKALKAWKDTAPEWAPPPAYVDPAWGKEIAQAKQPVELADAMRRPAVGVTQLDDKAATATGTSQPDLQASLPVELQDIALRRRVERARDWNVLEERNTVGKYYAAQDVESDLAALRGIADFQQRALTLRAMVSSAAHQVAYRDELLRQDPIVAEEAVRHADATRHTDRMPDVSTGLKRSDMTLEGYFDSLPADTGERPIFVTWLGGYVVPSHLELGSFPDSAWHAVSALARSRGLLLTDDTFGSDIRRWEVRGETLNTAVAEGDARFGQPPSTPTATNRSSSPVATATEPPVPATVLADSHEVRPPEPAAIDDELAQERSHLAHIRDRHAAVNAAGKTTATLTDDEAALLAQADAKSLRQIRRADRLVELATELGASLENQRYRAALEKADFQVAKAMESLHIEGQLLAERERVRASRPRGLQGVLVETGEAPFHFKDSQPTTFYAKYLEDNGREGVVWGRHLPAALHAGGAEIGDRIWFVRKATPPELRENSQGLLPCDLAEFALEVREKGQLPDDTPDASTEAPGHMPTYRFRISDPAASRAGPVAADVVLSENVAGLAAALDVRRGRRVHVEDFRLGQVWQLEIDAEGTARSTQGSAFDIAKISDADAVATIEQEEPAATPPSSSTEQEIDKRLRQRVATLRAQDLERARHAVGLSAPQPVAQGENDRPATPSQVHAGAAPTLPPAPSSRGPAGKASGGQQAAPTAAPLKGANPTPAADASANGFTGDPADASRPTPSEFISKLLESITYEMKSDGSVLYLVRDRPAFVDHGQQILMHKTANDDDEAVLAAILLAKEKWGGKIELTGTEEFKRRALAVMLKHNVDVQLKNPQQEALRRELAQSTPPGDVPQDDAGPKPLMGKPAPKHANDARPDVSASRSTSPAPSVDAAASTAVSAPVPTPVAAAAPRAEELAPIQARDWWEVQRDAIHYWARNPTERDADLKRLGPEPAETHMFWFDKAGRRCDPPADAEAFATRVTAANANSKERNMATKQGTPQEPPQVVLRGVKKVGEKFETTALLFKGKGDFLQGFITVGGQKRQVIVHMNERKPDSETGEVRPNFLRISEAQGDAKNPQWREIGYGNAVNHRADGKPVYFDEVLFNVGNDVVKARATGSVDEALHRTLGFMEPRRSRAAANDSPDRPADASLPKAAPAADVREAVAGAAAPTKSRHSARSRAAA